MKSFIMSAMAVNLILMMNMMNPVAVVVIIVMSSLLVCVLVKMMISSSWFSYILFMIFLGGLMVLFTYVCSLASNEQMSMKGSIYTLSASFVLVFLVAVLAPQCQELSMNTKELMQYMFSWGSASTLSLTMVYLLMTLFACVMVAQMKFGPMRAKKWG